jgi:spore coat protein CotF
MSWKELVKDSFFEWDTTERPNQSKDKVIFENHNKKVELKEPGSWTIANKQIYTKGKYIFECEFYGYCKNKFKKKIITTNQRNNNFIKKIK